MIVHGTWRGCNVAAILNGKQVADLFIEPSSRPNLTGGVARVKISQVKTGGLICFVDLPFGERGYLQSKTPRKAGEFITVEITGWPTGDKAWPVKRAAQQVETDGWVVVPPAVLDRARMAAPKAKSEPLPEAALDDLLAPLLATEIEFGNGSRLTLSPTPALLAIDVDSGGQGNYTTVNREAGRLLAVAIRNRNLSGQIVVDFCRDKPGRTALLTYLQEQLAGDPAAPALYGQTKLGLVELTRPRLGPSIWEAVDAE